ncbi:MAG: dihydroorotate oxidase [Spirochaetes bacterium]|nr:MAG: dihydroorotate oxidase [Spirochaetota bacterium]
MADLSTTYMGLTLKNPIIVASSSLTSSVDGVKRCEDAGAGAVILKSLFEEQITFDTERMIGTLDYNAYTDAYDMFASSGKDYYLNEYLTLVEKAKKSVSLPVIPSINCVSSGNWIEYAERFENVGADALELNVFILPSNPDTDAETIEKAYFDILKEVKKHVKIPVAMKIGYHFSAMGRFIKQLSQNGADGMVLFNRFYKIDIDTKTMKLKPSPILSNPVEMALSLQWVALISGEIDADISAATGIHNGDAVVKQLLAGAKSVQLCSVLMNEGLDTISEIRNYLSEWMDGKGFGSIDDFRGKLSQSSSEHPESYERSQYVKALVGIS